MRGTARTATAAAAAAVLLAAGCGTGHGPGPHRDGSLIAAAVRAPATGVPAAGVPATGAPATGAVTTGPPVIGRAQAQRLVRALLGRAQLPPGARPWPGRPPAALAQPVMVAGGSPSAAVHRLWRVAEPASAVYAFVSRHVPPGMTLIGSGRSASRGTVTEQDVTFHPGQLPAGILPAGVAAAGLTMSVVPAGPGTSVLRADAQVVWFPPRSAAEYVPATMHAVTVTATAYRFRQRPRTLTKTITAPSAVRRLAALLNGAHAATAGGFISCPAELASYRVAFAVSSRATPYLVARATVCPDTQVRLRGHSQPPLVTPPGLLDLLQRLTGVLTQPGGRGTAPANPRPSRWAGPSRPIPLPGSPIPLPSRPIPRPGSPAPWLGHPAPWVTSVPRA